MSRRTIFTLFAVVVGAISGILMWYSTTGDHTWHFVAACFGAIGALACWEERHHT